jgi:signal transduction histidine kinase
MSGFSQALTEDYGDLLQGEARMYLDQIGIASEKMSELIDGLLVLSRCTRGTLHNDEINLSALSERLLAELARNDPARQVEIRVEAGIMVNGDACMIKLVMQNLLSNAWKYTAKRPIASIQVFTDHQDGVNRFCVADNGAGFDMAYANRLFQPFQRLHRQEEFPGTGVGLATVQRIIQRHGGQIEAVGEPEKGARFYFTLSNMSPDSVSTDNKD